MSIPLTLLQKDIKHNNRGDSASNTNTMLFKNNPEQIHVSIPAESMSSDPGQCNGENKIYTIHLSLLGCPLFKLRKFWKIVFYILESMSCKGPFKFYISKEVSGWVGGVRKWQFLMIQYLRRKVGLV